MLMPSVYGAEYKMTYLYNKELAGPTLGGYFFFNSTNEETGLEG